MFRLLIVFSLFYPFSLCAEVWVSAQQSVMGTLIRAEVSARDQMAGERAIAQVFDEMHRIDRQMSPYKPRSELSQVNRLASRSPVSISTELFGLLQRSVEVSVLSAGSFDITYASAGKLYNYRQAKGPTATELIKVLRAINYRHLQLDSQAVSVYFKQPGVSIDLGGIAKGHAVDRAIARLQAIGIEHAMVAAGGDSRFIGQRDGGPWVIGIKDPRQRDAVIARLPLTDLAISTSGDYERFFIRDGERFHHILNPSNGTSAKGLRSVSVLGPEATMTDALATAVFVMGLKKGMELINSLELYDAVLVGKSGSLHFTDQLVSAVK